MTNFDDAIYDATALGVASSSYFTLSAGGNEVVLASAGALSNQNVVGIAYNSTEWEAGDALGARDTITISPLVDGAASGDAPTTLTVGVSASGGLPIAVLLANRQAVEVTYEGGTSTYTIDLSAATFGVTDKNKRRLMNAGII